MKWSQKVSFSARNKEKMSSMEKSLKFISAGDARRCGFRNFKFGVTFSFVKESLDLFKNDNKTVKVLRKLFIKIDKNWKFKFHSLRKTVTLGDRIVSLNNWQFLPENSTVCVANVDLSHEKSVPFGSLELILKINIAQNNNFH